MASAFFDIETGGLEPRKDKVWCMSWVDSDTDEPRTLSLFGIRSEGLLIQRIQQTLGEYGEIVSWNGWKFDVPFINYRNKVFGLPRLEHPLHNDLRFLALRRYNPPRSTMAGFLRHFGYPENPYPFDEGIWFSAGVGDEAAQQHVINHCEADVKGLKFLYGKLMLDGPDESEAVADAIRATA